jgi:hypothetical protein
LNLDFFWFNLVVAPEVGLGCVAGIVEELADYKFGPVLGSSTVLFLAVGVKLQTRRIYQDLRLGLGNLIVVSLEVCANVVAFALAGPDLEAVAGAHRREQVAKAYFCFRIFSDSCDKRLHLG